MTDPVQAALLRVMERALHDLMDDTNDPHDDGMRCLWCNEVIFDPHEPDCPWPLIRKAYGW